MTASFVKVIRATGSRPASVFARQLEVLTAQLSDLTTQFYTILLRLADWRSLGADEIEAAFGSLEATYIKIFDNLDQLFELLRTTAHFEKRRVTSRQMIDEIKQQLFARRYEEQNATAHT